MYTGMGIFKHLYGTKCNVAISRCADQTFYTLLRCRFQLSGSGSMWFLSLRPEDQAYNSSQYGTYSKIICFTSENDSFGQDNHFHLHFWRYLFYCHASFWSHNRSDHAFFRDGSKGCEVHVSLLHFHFSSITSDHHHFISIYLDLASLPSSREWICRSIPSSGQRSI